LLVRIRAKVERAFRRVPLLDTGIVRKCHKRSADDVTPSVTVDVIITSPPYMRQLDYARDNRLRLWFLGVRDWRELDKAVSPREAAFLDLMRRCFRRWRSVLRPGGHCVLIVGDSCSRDDRRDLPGVVATLATQQGFFLVSERSDAIPNERRVRRGLTGNTSETILVLRNAPQSSGGAATRKAHAALQH
jgi:hypothetical protein